MISVKDRTLQEVENFKTFTANSKAFPVFAPSPKDVINLIDLYWVDRFKDNDYDDLGDKKFFYNVVETPCLVASKMIDIDTKDILIIPEDGASEYPAWLFGKELGIWMKSKKNINGQTFGQILNDFVYNFPKYGHLFVKKTGKSICNVPLQNIYYSPSVRKILSSPYIIEEHCWSLEDFETYADLYGWKNSAINSILADARYRKLKDIYVYERYGYVAGTKKNYFIVSDVNSEILFSDTIKKEDLYKEIKWDDIPRRAMGRGFVEKLFEAQIHTNKVQNYKTQGLHWTSKHLYQTRATNFNKNLMTETDNGEVIEANAEITPIVNEERNLSAYQEEESRIDQLVDKRTFSYDTMRGERAPSGTPLGSSVLQSQMASGFFDLKKEDLSLFIKEILEDWILPDFKDGRNLLHTLSLQEFDENEVNKIRNLITKSRLSKRMVGEIAKNGLLDQKQIDVLKAIINEEVKKEKDLTIDADFYSNLKYKIKIVITNENIDTGARMTTLQTIMQILGSNPTVLQDPKIKGIFDELVGLSGISPTRFDEDAQPDMSEQVGQAMMGGSIAAQKTVPASVVKSKTTI
jgi:hypothetical protein